MDTVLVRGLVAWKGFSRLMGSFFCSLLQLLLFWRFGDSTEPGDPRAHVLI